VQIFLTVNGERHRVDVEARRTLADALREDLGLTGTHLGCEHGVCGACTIIVDGRPVRACLMFAVQADGASIATVEGLADDDGTLHPLQEAFSRCHGLQCSACTPGMLMTAVHLLDTEPDPSRDRIRAEMAGNLCRCTGYAGIVDAVESAAARQRELASEASSPDDE
jgi:carbon-monoxide dehydrogenase small subunit